MKQTLENSCNFNVTSFKDPLLLKFKRNKTEFESTFNLHLLPVRLAWRILIIMSCYCLSELKRIGSAGAQQKNSSAFKHHSSLLRTILNARKQRHLMQRDMNSVRHRKSTPFEAKSPYSRAVIPSSHAELCSDPRKKWAFEMLRRCEGNTNHWLN